MAKNAKLKLPFAPLPDLMRWWRSQRIRGAIIGGLAVALLGRPRVTRDVDALILLAESRWKPFLASGKHYGFLPRQPDALAFAREARVLLLRHRPSGIDVDIALGNLPFEKELVARSIKIKVSRVSIPLPSTEDLLILKAVANRERDRLDIEGLLAGHPDLDLRRIRTWVRAFAEALESPALFDDLDRQLVGYEAKRRSKRKNG